VDGEPSWREIITHMKVTFELDVSSILAADDVRLRRLASSGSRRARDVKWKCSDTLGS